MSKIADPFSDGYRHLNHLPDSTLRDLARNDAAPRDYRKFAVELLWVRESPYVKHTDLREFVRELEAEYEGISFEFPPPTAEEGPGPLTSSVTTTTMFEQEPEVVDNDKVEYHVDQVPAVLPKHSGEVLKVVSPKTRKQKSDAD
jgi:hypothetical protein